MKKKKPANRTEPDREPATTADHADMLVSGLKDAIARLDARPKLYDGSPVVSVRLQIVNMDVAAEQALLDRRARLEAAAVRVRAEAHLTAPFRP